MAIDSQLPAWLQQRSFIGEGVTQGAQVGFNMGIQLRQQARIERAQKLQEEAMRLALEEKERIAEGTVAVTRVLSEMGKTGGYNDPVLKSKFWDTIAANPNFANSKVFKDIMDTFQNAEQAQARKELLEQTYDLRGDAAEQRHLLRLEEIDAQLEKALETENLSQDHRLELEDRRQRNRQEMLRLRPTGTRPAQLDLDRSDQMLMDAELDNLKTWRSIHSSTKYDAEYEQRLRGIEQKFAVRKKTTAQPAPATSDKRVRVVSPDGKVGNIPESQLEEALKQGYKPAP